MPGKIIAGNWKMNPNSSREALRLFSAVTTTNYPSEVEIIMCPPYPYLYLVANAVRKNIYLGAQNVFWEQKGAYTGEVSPNMLAEVGVSYVILGHSERREHFNETDDIVADKLNAALNQDLRVILCVGEDAKTRKRGPKAAKTYVKKQLLKVLAEADISSSEMAERVLIAYEPIWAISSNKSAKAATGEDAAEMADHIKNTLAKRFKVASENWRVLYGGSTNPHNVAEFVEHDEVDGVLVGDSSLRASRFKRMIRIVAEYAEKEE